MKHTLEFLAALLLVPLTAPRGRPNRSTVEWCPGNSSFAGIVEKRRYSGNVHREVLAATRTRHGLACSIYSGEQPGPAAEMGLR